MTLKDNTKIKKEYGLTLAEAYILFAITNSYEKNERCEFTQEQISLFLGIEIRTVGRSIKRLEELRLIEVKRNGKHKMNSYVPISFNRTKCHNQ